VLKRIDNIIGPDLLRALRAMGHGDEIAIVDSNYPGDSNGPELIRMDGVDGPRILDAILELMPLDDFVKDAAIRMEIGRIEPIFVAYEEVVRKHEPEIPMTSMAPPAFYERVKRAYCIVQSGERALYGNLLLKKGVIRPGVG
jgi:L-fucose mutarotase